MAREPLRDIKGRQYGETVRGATVRFCSGEDLGLVEYHGKDNEHVLRAFARDVEQGHYNGRIVYAVTTALGTDEDSTMLWVYFNNGWGEYEWGLEPPK